MTWYLKKKNFFFFILEINVRIPYQFKDQSDIFFFKKTKTSLILVFIFLPFVFIFSLSKRKLLIKVFIDVKQHNITFIITIYYWIYPNNSIRIIDTFFLNVQFFNLIPSWLKLIYLTLLFIFFSNVYLLVELRVI